MDNNLKIYLCQNFYQSFCSYSFFAIILIAIAVFRMEKVKRGSNSL
jgi:hypothetical protein